VLAVLLLLMSWWVGVLALRRFDFYDMSIFLDAGWRVARGQRMYVDFFYIAGPVHPYLYAVLIRLLGFNKWAVLVFLLGTQAAVLASSYAMARRAFSPLLAALFAAAAGAACVLSLAHPWYDLTAFALLLAGWAAVDVFDPFAQPRHSWSAAVAGATAALAFLAKTNVGLAGGGMLLLALVLRAVLLRRWRPVAWYALSGLVVLAILILTLASPAEYLRQNFVDFGTSGRLARFGRMGAVLTELPYTSLALATAVLAWAGGPRWSRRFLPTLLMAVVVFVTGVFSLWTGSSLVVGGGYLVGVSAILLGRVAVELPQADEGRPIRRVPAAAWRVAAGLLAVLILYWAAGRALVGWNWRRSNVLADYALRTPGFEGWRCFRPTGEGVDRAAEAIRALVPAADTLLVIPDATVLYGMTGHDSYRGVPWAWDITSSPARGSRLYERTVNRLHQDKPAWILVHFQNDSVASATLALIAHLRLAPMIAAEYRPAWSWGDFVLLRRTSADGGGPPAAPR
ncbi:MAG TPA: hypothetical protein VFT38_07365, partial [Vicinamibacteria bacterium]|nr:hypothetical protein [Vicinamibacteria bacterium]